MIISSHFTLDVTFVPIITVAFNKDLLNSQDECTVQVKFDDWVFQLRVVLLELLYLLL